MAVFCVVYLFTYNVAEPKAYDFMTKNILVNKLPFDNHKQVYGKDNVVLIVIDEKSTEKYRWPWKREQYCKILNYIIYCKDNMEYNYAKYIFPKIYKKDYDRVVFNEITKMNNDGIQNSFTAFATVLSKKGAVSSSTDISARTGLCQVDRNNFILYLI